MLSVILGSSYHTDTCSCAVWLVKYLKYVVKYSCINWLQMMSPEKVGSPQALWLHFNTMGRRMGIHLFYISGDIHPSIHSNYCLLYYLLFILLLIMINLFLPSSAVDIFNKKNKYKELMSFGVFTNNISISTSSQYSAFHPFIHPSII